jgi:hypothetical protein
MLEIGSEKTQVPNKRRNVRQKSKKNKEEDRMGKTETHKRRNRDAT